MRIFLFLYGVVLAGAAAVLVRDPGFVGNVGFLIFGALLGIYPVFIIDEINRSRAARNVAKALFQELAKLVGGCCFDFEAPWKNLLSGKATITVDRLRKFIPGPPTVYHAMAPQLALLQTDQTQAVIDFYQAFAAWRRDAEDVANDFQASSEIPGKRVGFVAERLRRTLPPGKRALEALAKHVSEAEEIEKRAMQDGDQMFPDNHPNKGKTVRERIDLVLQGL